MERSIYFRIVAGLCRVWFALETLTRYMWKPICVASADSVPMFGDIIVKGYSEEFARFASRIVAIEGVTDAFASRNKYRLAFNTVDFPKLRHLRLGPGKVRSLESDIPGKVDCNHNQIATLRVPNAMVVVCEHNKLRRFAAPNAHAVDCSFNEILSLQAPKAKSVIILGNREDYRSKCIRVSPVAMIVS